jgi:hypothetical protein
MKSSNPSDLSRRIKHPHQPKRPMRHSQIGITWCAIICQSLPIYQDHRQMAAHILVMERMQPISLLSIMKIPNPSTQESIASFHEYPLFLVILCLGPSLVSIWLSEDLPIRNLSKLCSRLTGKLHRREWQRSFGLGLRSRRVSVDDATCKSLVFALRLSLTAGHVFTYSVLMGIKKALRL